MEIKKINEQNYLLKGNFCEVLLSLDGNYAKEYTSKENALVIDITSPESVSENHIITRAGEYEVNDVHVLAFDPTSAKKIDIVGIDVDGIKIVYVSGSVKAIAKSYAQQLGISNIAIVDLDGRDTAKLSAMVYEIEPRIVIPVRGNSGNLEVFCKDLGFEGIEPKKNLKYKQDEFKGEDSEAAVEILA